MRTKDENNVKLEFLAKSANESFARVTVAAFAAQMSLDNAARLAVYLH